MSSLNLGLVDAVVFIPVVRGLSEEVVGLFYALSSSSSGILDRIAVI